ncbi:DNase I-like protein [Durotheca rogersii]|uniref:DNase I-like protein n=1 Tax=Durotheca rogersii TaxID=419775 RepID=UPI002220D465|nr:DNase I-like protein [Durotheca rogersii]KAI5867758.1 DNase I-like protein [Durotheca rogersii]
MAFAARVPVPMLDVFILTFNAAKNEINVPVFARRLYKAFGESASTLPELIVISLQEMAPLATAFVGSTLIEPYFQKYISAVNSATARFAVQRERRRPPTEDLYTLVGLRNVGMTGIMLFARKPATLRNLRTAEVGFGPGEMANKGAVGLRVLYSRTSMDGTAGETELTFVATHLSAMEPNLEKRNRNWETIVSGLVFEEAEELAPLQCPRPNDQVQESTLGAVRNGSIYKPGTHLFVAGDLNYRISRIAPQTGSSFPNNYPGSPNYFMHFIVRDQLTAEKAAGRTLHGLSEAPVHFPPTYKLLHTPLEREPGDQDPDSDEVEWSYASHRWPSWCDRVLFLDVPWWARAKAGIGQMKVTAYNATPAVRSSDHKPVFLRLDVPIIAPADLAPTQAAYESAQRPLPGQLLDPRIKLPFPVSARFRQHRPSVRRWESTIGWSILLTQSNYNAVVLFTVLLVGLTAWWFRRSE